MESSQGLVVAAKCPQMYMVRETRTFGLAASDVQILAVASALLIRTHAYPTMPRVINELRIISECLCARTNMTKEWPVN